MGNGSTYRWLPAVVAAAGLLACAESSKAEPEPNPCGEGALADEDSAQCFCEPGFHGDADVECVAHPDLCGEAELRVGHTVCTHIVDDQSEWTRLSIGGGIGIGGIRRLGKYMVPSAPSSRLPTVFSDANSYRLHYCLMSAGFEPLFPGLTTAEHAALILTHAGREFYAGAVYEFETEAPTRFGFSIETAIRPEEMLSVDVVYAVYRQLSDRFEPGELGYLPRGTLQETAAAAWTDPPFPLLTANDESVTFEAYTPGLAYGRVRMHATGAEGEYSWQDIVVFDEVPTNYEGVLAAAVTGQRQDILSHLNVLSAQRGTPNFFVDGAVDVFAQFEGQLVRIETAPSSYTLRLATQAEAEAHWQQSRPTAAVENPADVDYTELDAFSQMPTSSVEERNVARARFGAKSVGLATLATLIDPKYQTPGLGVPFRYYDAFMQGNAWQVDVGDGIQTLSYADTVAAWLADEEFRTNAGVRKARLASLRDAMRNEGVVDPILVSALRERIATEFSAETVMVRVRSSSNAEDTPSFNGAGLYDSTSGCAADTDPDATSSACDPASPARTLERALAKVWASLWNFGAFEERDYFQMDHAAIAMGATISLRYEDELANGVAFTGNPLNPKQPRYTVNAQQGEVDVVSPTPGVSAELSYLTVVDGQVALIDRAVLSSLVESGETVVSDAHLRELGAVMATLVTTYPIDSQDVATGAPMLDLEFKITVDDALVIKQIRPFFPTQYSSDPTCR